MNSNKEDLGVLLDYEMDLAFGADENDFECVLHAESHCCKAGYYLYIENTEYGGLIDSIKSDTANGEVVYSGRTWHGILNSKVLEPDAGTAYLTVSGEVNKVLASLIARVGLSDLFEASSDDSGLTISSYKMNRYIGGYDGITKMLATVDARIKAVFKNGKVVLSAVKKHDYSRDEEFDSDQIGFTIKKNYNTVNHLICLGSGELAERLVVHLYVDKNGNISRTQTQFGVEEVSDIYEYSSLSTAEELVSEGTKHLKELIDSDEVKIDFGEDADSYEVGDVVGAYDNVTGLYITSKVAKKIVTIKNGQITISLIPDTPSAGGSQEVGGGTGSAGVDGVGILGVEVFQDSDTMARISVALTDGTIQEFPIILPSGDDGVGIYSVEQVSGGNISGLENEILVTLTNGEESKIRIFNGQKGEDGVGILGVDQTYTSTEDGGDNVFTVFYTDDNESTFAIKNGSKGIRGTGLLPVTTAPSSYTTEVGGITPKYRMAISTIKTQAGVTEVLLGDTVRYSYYHYPIAYLDASYAYFATRVSIRGSTGAAGNDGQDGKDGKDGATGKTAYQYAKEGGYTGTEAEFAKKLAGEMCEPADDDVPKVFLTGSEFSNMTNDKNEVNMEMEYCSKTKQFHAYIGIKYQGNSSLDYAKKNFTVKLFDDEAHESKQKHLFRDWKYEKNKFVLKANYIDHSHARNIVCANLWDEIVSSRSDYGSLPEELRNSPKNGAIDGFPIKLYVNGTYQGVYTWNISKDDWQWGMDEDNANHILLCVENNSDGVYKERPYNFRALWNGADAYFEAEIGTKDIAKNPINNLISFVMNNNGTAFRNGIGSYLDVQSAIDYYIHQYVICGLDGLAKNMLLGTYDGKKWYCGAYDMDSTFGLYWNGTYFVSPTYKCPEDYCEKFNLLWERLEANFWAEIKARYAQLRKSVYSIGNMFAHFEQFMDTIGLDLYAEDLEIFKNIPCGSTNNIKQLRNYIRDRLNYCDQQITNGVPATAITFSKTSVSLSINETATLTSTVVPSNTTDEILWLTSNSAIATISGGTIKAVATGSCEIIAKCGSGYAVCAVTVAANKTYYSVTNNLTNSKNSNSAASVEKGTSYSGTITANDGYKLDSVTVTMGGTNITSSAYSNGTINISSVTGNIVITVNAVKDIAYTNQVPISTDENGNVYNGTGYKDGYRVRSGGAEGEAKSTVTGFISAKAGDVMRLYCPTDGVFLTTTANGSAINVYDSSKTNLGQMATNALYGSFQNTSNKWENIQKVNGVFKWTVPSDVGNVAFIRLTVGFPSGIEPTGVGMIVTINEEIT